MQFEHLHFFKQTSKMTMDSTGLCKTQDDPQRNLHQESLNVEVRVVNYYSVSRFRNPFMRVGLAH